MSVIFLKYVDDNVHMINKKLLKNEFQTMII